MPATLAPAPTSVDPTFPPDEGTSALAFSTDWTDFPRSLPGSIFGFIRKGVVHEGQKPLSLASLVVECFQFRSQARTFSPKPDPSFLSPTLGWAIARAIQSEPVSRWANEPVDDDQLVDAPDDSVWAGLPVSRR